MARNRRFRKAIGTRYIRIGNKRYEVVMYRRGKKNPKNKGIVANIIPASKSTTRKPKKTKKSKR